MDSIFRNFEYFKFFVGQFFAHTADAMMQIILIAYVSAMYQPAGAKIAFVFFIFLFPQFVFSSFAGSVADKYSKRKILTISNIFRSVIAILVAVLAYFQTLKTITVSFLYIYLCAFLLGLGYAFYYAAKMSLLNEIVSPLQIKTANTINTGVINFLNIAGVAFAGIYILKVNLQTTILIASAFYFFTAISFFFISKNSINTIPIQEDNVFSEKTFEYIKKHKKIIYTLVISSIVSVTSAIFFNIINCLTVDVYNTGISGLVYFRTMVGIGILIGMAFSVAMFRYLKISQLQIIAFSLISIALYFTEFYKSYTSAFVPLLIIGLSFTVLLVSIDTTLMKITSKNKHGKVFGLQLACNTIAFLSGTLLMSKLPNLVDALFIMKSLSFLCISTTILLICWYLAKNIEK